MSQQAKSADVLIVGAGPTGLTLAIALRLHGVSVRIVDCSEHPTEVSKALAMWSGSLEALAGMDVVEQLLATGRRMRALSAGLGGRELALMKIGRGIDSPYPFPLLLPQSRTEQILTARLKELGVTIERGVELATLAQDGDGVTASLQHKDGRTEQVRTAYLAGCDGARSTVRHALDIVFEGYTEPATYLLCDVKIGGGTLDTSSIYIRWRKGGAVAMFPYEDGVWRIFAKGGENHGDAAPTLADMQAQVDAYGPGGLTLTDPTWLSAFRVNERLAARYRVGCCFLAGDAAHIHSPAGGQGMNTGIQDAVNLGWKLAYALAGRGNAELLLDSYEAERRPVARAVVDNATRMLHVAFGNNPFQIFAKSAAVALLGNLPAVQRTLQVRLSETEIVYRDGPLVALGAGSSVSGRTGVGGRARDAILRDPASGLQTPLWSMISAQRHSLLLFQDAERPIALDGIADGLSDQLGVIVIDRKSDPSAAARQRYRLDGPGWVLIRPDQVVAARGKGSNLEALRRYVDQVLQPAGVVAEAAVA